MGQKNIETYWSRFANEYEEKQSYVVGSEVIFLAKEELLKEHQLGRVLELGCGTGLYTETLQKIADNIVATDFSDEMIAFAKQKRGNLENIKFLQADALNLEFNEESFDTVFMANLVHVVGSAEKVIEGSNRVLKKGGLLIITSFAVDEMSLFNRIFIGVRYLKAFRTPPKEALIEKVTRKSVEALLINSGFKISKSIVLGTKSKAIYISSKKIKSQGSYLSLKRTGN